METKETPEYLHKIDTSKPGVYIARLNVQVPQEALIHIKENFESALGKGSKIIVLTADFDPVFIPDDKTMEKLGYIRKAT